MALWFNTCRLMFYNIFYMLIRNMNIQKKIKPKKKNKINSQTKKKKEI